MQNRAARIASFRETISSKCLRFLMTLRSAGEVSFGASLSAPPPHTICTNRGIVTLGAPYSGLPSRATARYAAGVRPRHPTARSDAKITHVCPPGMSTARRKSRFEHGAPLDHQGRVAKSPLAGRREQPRAPSHRAPHCQASYQERVGEGSTTLPAKPARTRRTRQGESRDLHTDQSERQCRSRRGGRCERLRAPKYCSLGWPPSRPGCPGHGSGSLRANELG